MNDILYLDQVVNDQIQNNPSSFEVGYVTANHSIDNTAKTLKVLLDIDISKLDISRDKAVDSLFIDIPILSTSGIDFEYNTYKIMIRSFNRNDVIDYDSSVTTLHIDLSNSIRDKNTYELQIELIQERKQEQQDDSSLFPMIGGIILTASYFIQLGDPTYSVSYMDKYIKNDESIHIGCLRSGRTDINLFSGKVKHIIDLLKINDKNLVYSYQNVITNDELYTSFDQLLIKEEVDEGRDIIYIDKNRDEHIIKERYYYLDEEDKKVYVKRDDIYLDDNSVDLKDKTTDNILKREATNEEGLQFISGSDLTSFKKREHKEKRYYVLLADNTRYYIDYNSPIIYLEFTDDNGANYLIQNVSIERNNFYNAASGNTLTINTRANSKYKLVLFDGTAVPLDKIPMYIDEEEGIDEECDVFKNERLSNIIDEIKSCENYINEYKREYERLLDDYNQFCYQIDDTASVMSLVETQADNLHQARLADIRFYNYVTYYANPSADEGDKFIDEYLKQSNKKNSFSYNSTTYEYSPDGGNIDVDEMFQHHQKVVQYLQMKSLKEITNSPTSTSDIEYRITNLQNYTQRKSICNNLFSYQDQLSTYRSKIDKLLEDKRSLIVERDKLIEEQKKDINDIIVDKEGNSLCFSYYGKLLKIQGKDEEEIDIEYEDDKIKRVYSKESYLLFSYEEDRLVSVIDNTGREVRYNYQNNRLKEIVLPDDNKIEIDQDSSYLDITTFTHTRYRYNYKDDILSSIKIYRSNTSIPYEGEVIFDQDVLDKTIDISYDKDQTTVSTLKGDITYTFDNNGRIVKIEDDKYVEVYSYIKEKLSYYYKYKKEDVLSIDDGTIDLSPIKDRKYVLCFITEGDISIDGNVYNGTTFIRCSRDKRSLSIIYHSNIKVVKVTDFIKNTYEDDKLVKREDIDSDTYYYNYVDDISLKNVVIKDDKKTTTICDLTGNILSIEDSNGFVTRKDKDRYIRYNRNDPILIQEEKENNDDICYVYDHESNDLIGLYNKSGCYNSTIFKYRYDLITEITSSRTSLFFSYDDKERITDVYLNKRETPYIHKDYLSEYKERTVLNTGLVEEVTRNSLDDVVERKIGSDTFSYIYRDDRLKEIRCNSIIVKSFSYDIYDRLESIDESYLYTYDDEDRLISFITPYSREDYNYDRLNRIGNISNGLVSRDIHYDSLNRVIDTATHLDSSVDIKDEYSYDVDQEKTNSLIRQHDIKIDDRYVSTSYYSYDDRGRLKEIDSDDGLYRYSYDSIGRIIREDNPKLDKTIIIKYDSLGNIIGKKTYPYSLDQNLFSPIRKDYIYKDNKLVSFDNRSILYDNCDRPISYLGNNITYDERGLITSFGDTSFTYDCFGLRTSKTSNNTTTRYIYFEKKLLKEIVGDKEVLFIYLNNSLAGFKYLGNTYLYTRDIQGDITSIVDSLGNVLVRYYYDCYGNTTIEGDTLLSSLNPFTYRGYIFDSETGLYYLYNRYYDPSTSRFITADRLQYLSYKLINGINLYSYCFNDPINYKDEEGNFGILTLLLIGALTGATISLASTVIDQAINDTWDWRIIVSNTVFGAAIGIASISPWPSNILLSTLITSSLSALNSVTNDIILNNGLKGLDVGNLLANAGISFTSSFISSFVMYGSNKLLRNVKPFFQSNRTIDLNSALRYKIDVNSFQYNFIKGNSYFKFLYSYLLGDSLSSLPSYLLKWGD